MPYLRLEGSGDALDLMQSIPATGGIAVLTGTTGMGLPGIVSQWNEGAGDGAQFLSSRSQARDIDLPIFATAPNRADLKTLMVRASRMLNGPMTLYFVDDDGTEWSLDVRRVGGGDIAFGPNTQVTNWVTTVVTLRAGDPCWTSSEVSHHEVAPSLGRGLLGTGRKLIKMQLDPSQTLGDFTMENSGDAPAYPVWTVKGAASAFTITSSTGEAFSWAGTLADGASIVIDSKAASVVDGATGSSRYSEMGPAPRLWRVPPGITTAHVAVTGSDASTRVIVEWRARKWAVL